MVTLPILTFDLVLPDVSAAPLWTLVLLISLAVSFLMVLAFRYTSNQQAIRRAKDRLKAHLLAVRLFQDQLSVVLYSYGRFLGELALISGMRSGRF